MIVKEPDSTVDALKRAIVEPASKLLAAQQLMEKEVRTKSLDAYNKLTEAHMLATGAIGSALWRVNGNRSIYKIESAARDRSALVASFVIGIGIVEQAITGGYYLQAAALLRQELETLAALAEIELGTRREGQQPNVRSIEQLKHLYGDLSAAAHVARRHIVELATLRAEPLEGMSTDTVVTRYVPDFDLGTARRLYSAHVLMMLLLSEHLDANLTKSYGEGLTALERKCVQAALRILVEEECVILSGSP